MKNKIIAIVIIILVILGLSYLLSINKANAPYTEPVAQNGEPVVPTGNPTDPSIQGLRYGYEPVDIPAEWETYVGSGIQISFPPNWVAQQGGGTLIQLFNFDPSNIKTVNDRFKLEIVELPAFGSSNLRNWVDNFIENQEYQTEVLGERGITVDQREAIYQLVRVGSVSNVIVYVWSGHRVFLISATPINEEYEVILNDILKSLILK